MRLLLLIVLATAALAGSVVAFDEDVVWTEDMVEELLSKADLSDVNLTAPELITKYGYDAEVHHVTTEDGYILTMHRISGGPASPTAEGKPVFFLMHGLSSSSVDWIIMGPGKGFGYILADAGFDVWMGNARGNRYSKNHTTYTDFDGRDFWKFDWHHIGVYDLPAMIDYVLAVTDKEKLFYAGHSQGTTVFYVMATELPEYNDKIKASFSLAPIAYMSNLKSPFMRIVATYTNSLSTFFNLFGINDIAPSSPVIAAAGERFCNDDALTQFMCTNLLYVFFGFNRAQTNATMLPVIFGHTPAGASSRQLVHYGQQIQSGEFRWWDYGQIGNRITYGSVSPPNYELSKITSPTHLIYSDNDWMAAVEDVEQIWSELGNPTELYRVLDGKWNHIDYIWGIDAKEFVYDPIIATVAANYAD